MEHQNRKKTTLHHKVILNLFHVLSHLFRELWDTGQTLGFLGLGGLGGQASLGASETVCLPSLTAHYLGATVDPCPTTRRLPRMILEQKMFQDQSCMHVIFFFRQALFEYIL